MTAVRVIKEGDLSRVTSTKRFECERCGCVWEASGAEYLVTADFRNGKYFAMDCPTCHRVVTMYPEDEKG